jgi:hypothetical protein
MNCTGNPHRCFCSGSTAKTLLQIVAANHAQPGAAPLLPRVITHCHLHCPPPVRSELAIGRICNVKGAILRSSAPPLSIPPFALPPRLHRDTRRPGLRPPRHHDRTSILDISQRSKTAQNAFNDPVPAGPETVFIPLHPDRATKFRSNFGSGIAVSFSAGWPFATARREAGDTAAQRRTQPAPSRGTVPNGPQSRLHEGNALTVSRTAKYG